ncbi:MAG: ABC transporter permease [Christensenellales bacterium]|jgi:putative aldouronate transport system permease protein
MMNVPPIVSRSRRETLLANIRKYPWLYLIMLPVVVFYFVYWYIPLGGLVIAFQNYKSARGIFASHWVGFKNFLDFFSARTFWRLIRNTLSINLQLLLFGFPFPILFAILLNEVRSTSFRRVTQTITYMPHFVSSVVVAGLMIDFTETNGLLTNFLRLFGVPNEGLLTKASWFQPLYVLMNIWQEFGWDSIIYLAALTGIDMQLYEAAKVDGANRIQQTMHVTLPGISTTVTLLLILRIGNMMSLGWDRIILLYNPMTYETADVVSTYVYREGLVGMRYSYGTAAGMFNSVINVSLLVMANAISRRISDNSLW